LVVEALCDEAFPMNYAQFHQLLKRSEYHALYLVSGPEAYLRRLAIRQLVDRYVDRDGRQLSVSTFGDSLDEVESALATAATWPMGSKKRLVLIAGPGIGSKGPIEMLGNYFLHPSTKTVIVLEIEELRKDSALPNLAKDHGVQVECQPLKAQECAAWLTQHSKEQGFALLADACSSLISRIGNSLQDLVVNLDKVMAYVGEPGRISRRHVLEVVGESRELPLWELSDAVTRGDSAAALSILDSCLRQGEAPLVLLAVISKVFRHVILAKELLQAGADADEVGRHLHIPAFKLAEFLRAVKSVPERWAKDLYAGAAEIDDLMKASAAPPRILLETLVCRAALPDSARRQRYTDKRS
jgi:DNA polymerase III subunit delta